MLENFQTLELLYAAALSAKLKRASFSNLNLAPKTFIKFLFSRSILKPAATGENVDDT